MTLLDLLMALTGPSDEEMAARQAEFDARNVAQDHIGDAHISTVMVPADYTGGRTVYQTGIFHPQYQDDGTGDNIFGQDVYVVCGEYESKEAALDGHAAWVSVFSGPADRWPEALRDVSSVEAMKDLNGRVYKRTERTDVSLDEIDEQLAS